MKVTVHGLDHCLKRLARMQKTIPDKTHELIEKLGALGITEAQMRFNLAPYDGDRDAEVGSLVWVNENTAQIIASGSTVLFIEFGAGIYYGEEAGAYAQNHGYGPGTYGPHGWDDYWFYRGDPGTAGGEYAKGKDSVVITHGNPAARPMYYAAEEMRKRISEIAREVFG